MNNHFGLMYENSIWSKNEQLIRAVFQTNNWNRWKEKQFKHMYEQLVWAETWIFNINRNINIHFEQIYEQSIWTEKERSIQTETWTINLKTGRWTFN